jgi:hypothetical protein
MSQKQTAKRRGRKKTVTVLGAAGVLSLAGGASAAVVAPAADTLKADTASRHVITLSEEEIFDVSLATFYVYDRENSWTRLAGPPPARAVATAARAVATAARVVATAARAAAAARVAVAEVAAVAVAAAAAVAEAAPEAAAACGLAASRSAAEQEYARAIWSRRRMRREDGSPVPPSATRAADACPPPWRGKPTPARSSATPTGRRRLRSIFDAEPANLLEA